MAMEDRSIGKTRIENPPLNVRLALPIFPDRDLHLSFHNHFPHAETKACVSRLLLFYLL